MKINSKDENKNNSNKRLYNIKFKQFYKKFTLNFYLKKDSGMCYILLKILNIFNSIQYCFKKFQLD